jgi:hypothetical protein
MKHLDGTGRATQKNIAIGGRDAPGGLRDEGTTGVAIFDLRGGAFLRGARDAARHDCGSRLRQCLYVRPD